MKINFVTIINMTIPSSEFWDGVKSRADDPLIQAHISMTLSWREYEELLERNRHENDPAGSDIPPH